MIPKKELIDKLSTRKSAQLIVKANSRKTKVAGYDKERDVFILEVSAPPENNRANIEIIKHLSSALKKEIKIVRGVTSKKKIIRIMD